jgi:hypothetical protein
MVLGMSILSKCPYCHRRVRVPDRALAASMKCPCCKSWYTVTGDAEPTHARQHASLVMKITDSDIEASRKTPLEKTPLAVVESTPKPVARTQNPATSASENKPKSVAKPQPPVDDQTPLPTSVVVVNMHLGTTPDEPEVSSHGWSPHPLGLVACIAGGLALVASTSTSTTVLTRPLSAVGLILGLVAILLAAGGRPIRQLFPIIGAVLSGLTLLVALFDPSLLGPRYEVSRERSDYDPEELKVIPLNLGLDRSQGLETDGWVDASRAAIQQGLVRVQVTGASIAPVQVVDSTRRFTKTPYLMVLLRVQHLGHGGAFRFIHWGEKAERTVAAAIATCNGLRLSSADLAADVPVGVKYGHELFPGKAVDDLLILDVPAGSGPIKLELPGEAWNGHTAFRFLIPPSMMAIQQNPKK